jgi:hypothetical protein
VGVGFVSGVESSEAAEPGVGAFDDPAVAGVGVASADHSFAASGAGPSFLVGEVGLAGSASAADPGFDSSLADVVSERVAAVATVGPELGRQVAVCE